MQQVFGFFPAVSVQKLQEAHLVDNWAEANVLAHATLQRIVKSAVDVRLQELKPPTVFDTASSTPSRKRSQIICCSKESIGIELLIQHGSSVLIQKVPWPIEQQQIFKPLLGKPLQELLGLKTEELLAAVAVRFRSCIYAEDALQLAPIQGEVCPWRVMNGVSVLIVKNKLVATSRPPEKV